MKYYLCLSDIHFFSVVKDQYNNIIFNTTECKKRMDKVFSEATKGLKKYNIKKMGILFVGDIIDGESIYPGHNHNVEGGAFEQINEAVSYFYEKIMKLLDICSRINIYCVKGNHGRVSKFSKKNTNFDLFVYENLKNKLVDNRVRLDYSHKDIGLFEDDGFRILMKHIGVSGDSFASNKKKLGAWKYGFDFDVFVCGHFHNYGLLNWQGVPVVRNSSIQEPTEYAHHLGEGFGFMPSQVAFMVQDKRIKLFRVINAL